MSLLPPRPEDCSFSNGEGYIQHDKDILLGVRKALLEYCIEYYKGYSVSKWIQACIDDDSFDIGYVARVLDGSPRHINSALYRFMSIDDSNREWGQPYFARNPSEGTLICLNDGSKEC